jgi:hypothetical protein
LVAGQQRGRDELNRRAEATQRDAADRDLKSVRRGKQQAANKAAVRRSTLKYAEDGRIDPSTVVPLGPFRGGMPPEYAGTGRAPLAGTVPAPSGTLPGEEQVTTADTLAQLTPDERKQLEAKYQQSGMAGTGGMETLEDWASTHFGEMPPQERLSAMRHAAGMQMPPQTIVPQEELEPGQRSPLAGARVAAGGVLPEGRPLPHYGKTQRRQMGTNIWNPHARMTVFGGTHAHNPDGSLSARAPRTESLDLAKKAAAEYGEGSDAHIIALGQAYNIDVGQYGNDMDVLRADVMREKERHDRLATKYDTIPTPMGAHRYTPNAKMREDEQKRNRKSFAMRIIQRYAGMNGDSPDAGLTPAQADQAQKFADRVKALANGTDHDAAMSQLRDLNESLSGRRLESAVRTQKARLQSEGITRDLNNPRMRQGFLIRALQSEGRAAARGSIQDVIGNPEAAAGERALAAAEAAAAAAAIKAEKEAEIAGRKPNPADDMARALSTALALPPGALQHAAVKAAVITSGMATADNANAEADRIIADHEASRNPGGEGSKKRLYDLAWTNDWNGFTRLAKVMGLTDEQALEVWKKAQPVTTGWRNFVNSITGGGVFTGGAPAPPAGPPMTAGPSAPPAARGGK